MKVGVATSMSWQPLGAPLPLEPGRWTLVLWDGPTLLKRAGFDVVVR